MSLDIIITIETLNELSQMIHQIVDHELTAIFNLKEIPVDMYIARNRFQRAIVYCEGLYRGEFYFEDIRFAEDYTQPPFPPRWGMYLQMLGEIPNGYQAQLIFSEWNEYKPPKSFYVTSSLY